MKLHRERHDKILQHIIKTINYNNRKEDIVIQISQSIPDLQNDTLRPDTIIQNNSKSIVQIIDLAIIN